ncbi:MAG TPA: DUF2652 domain-containing protein [Chitinophagales bacterium]|nr:DUF2652 domain-containing protein [Chitinophagales bacterium]
MTEPHASAIQKALLFFPDISGFTQFVGDRDLQHGHHIIAELLEILIEANELNLKVSEVEGDAIFFYRTGDAPDVNDLVAQCEKMYIAFHHHLKKYGVSRLCNCTTCRSVSRLTLKFVAHYGDVSFHSVKKHQKLLGTDVIVAHRLLKNNIPDHEYLLVTNSIADNSSQLSAGSNLQWQPGSNSYDLGEVKYEYCSLSNLYEKVPEPEIPEVTIHRSKNPMVHSIEIAAPIDMVYDSLIDLSQRKNYMVGLKHIEIREEQLNRLNRICTTFKCAMEHEHCTFETSGVEFGDNKVTFFETFKEYPMTFDYVLEQKNGKTSVSIIVHPALKFPMRWMFNLVMKRKFSSELIQTLAQLKKYCEERFTRQK